MLLFENYNSIKLIADKYDIKDYTINVDGSIDVDGDVNLSKRDLTELPIMFNYVSGIFYCYDNKLTTLKGAPKEIGGYFLCYNNKLTTLVGAPKKIGIDFYCNNNNLTSLVGAPKEIGGGFCCNNNNLTSLKWAPNRVGGSFYCNNNNLPKEILANIEHINFIVRNGEDYSIWNSTGTLNIYRFRDMMLEI